MRKIFLILINCAITLVMFNYLVNFELNYFYKISLLIFLQVVFLIQLYNVDKKFFKSSFLSKPKHIWIYLVSVFPIYLYSSFSPDITNFIKVPFYKIIGDFFKAATLEEILIRLLVFILLFKLINKYRFNKKNILISLFFSSFIFGILHLNNMTIDTNFAFRQVYTSFCVGCLLATIFIKTGNIIALFIIHFLMNFLGEIQASISTLFVTSQIEGIIETVLFFVIFGSPLILSIFILYKLKYKHAIKISHINIKEYY